MTTTRALRIPTAIWTEVEAEARQMGQTPSYVILRALRARYDLPAAVMPRRHIPSQETLT